MTDLWGAGFDVLIVLPLVLFIIGGLWLLARAGSEAGERAAVLRRDREYWRSEMNDQIAFGDDPEYLIECIENYRAIR